MEIPHRESFLFSVFGVPLVGRGLATGVLGIFIPARAMVVCQRFDRRGIPVNAGDTSGFCRVSQPLPA